MTGCPQTFSLDFILDFILMHHVNNHLSWKLFPWLLTQIPQIQYVQLIAQILVLSSQRGMLYNHTVEVNRFKCNISQVSLNEWSLLIYILLSLY